MSGFSVLEYEILEISKQTDVDAENKALTTAEVEALYALGDRLGQRIIERMPRGRVRFRQFVGLVRVGGRDIEVLPKIESENRTADSSKSISDASIRQNLISMLLVAFDTKTLLPGDTQSVLEKSTWLDAFIRIFCQNLAEQVRRGLVKRYRIEEDNLHVVQGRILIDEQIRQNLIHRERTVCEFDELDENHALNQVFKLVVSKMLRVARNNATQQCARELLASFDAVELKPAVGGWWNHIYMDRLSARYQPALQMAKIFLSGMSPNLAHGSKDSFSLLFDMNILFEEYIGRILRQELRTKLGLSVQLQDKQHYLIKNSIGERLFQLKPDIVVRDGNEVMCIGDTKWKRLDLEHRKLGVSQADLYQMLAYAQQYKCQRLLLLYPFESGFGQPLKEGNFLEYDECGVTVLVGQICLADLNTVPSQLKVLYESAVAGRC